MDILFSICLGVGLGMAAGTVGAATGRLAGLISPAILGVIVIGAAVALAAGLAREDAAVVAAVAGAAGAAVAAVALGDLVIATHRRAQSTAGVTIWLLGFAVAVAGLSLLWPPLALVALIALVYLWMSRRRREARKYKGLRSLT